MIDPLKSTVGSRRKRKEEHMQCTKQRSFLIFVCSVAVCCAAALPLADRLAASTPERAQVVLSRSLPELNGRALKATLVRVNYGPGEASAPHSHPCAVIGYVVRGAIRTRVEGEPESIYQTGQSFYEAPHGVHAVSANARSTESAAFLAYFVCDRDVPLSIDVPRGRPKKGD